MTFGEVKQEVARMIDYSGSNATAMIENWIRYTRREIATKFDFPFLFTIATTTTTSSNTYNFPSDYLDHLMILMDDEDGNPILLYEMTPGYWANLFKIPSPLDISSDTPPYRVLIEGNYFRIIPDPPSGRTLTLYYYRRPDDLVEDNETDYFLNTYPDAVIWGSGRTLTLYYYRRPDDLVEDNETDYFLNTYPDAVIWGASLRGAVYLDDEQKVAKFKPLYEDALKAMIARENRKRIDRRGAVRFKTWKDFSTTTVRRMFGVY